MDLGAFSIILAVKDLDCDNDAHEVEGFTDFRELQRQLKAHGLAFQQEADEDSSGPASFVVVDPDGNPILVDQHV